MRVTLGRSRVIVVAVTFVAMMIVSFFAPRWDVLYFWGPPFLLFAVVIRNVVSLLSLAIAQVAVLVATTYETATSTDSFIYIIHWVVFPPLILAVRFMQWSMNTDEQGTADDPAGGQ